MSKHFDSVVRCPACGADISDHTQTLIDTAIAGERRKRKKLGKALDEESTARKKAKKQVKALEDAVVMAGAATGAGANEGVTRPGAVGAPTPPQYNATQGDALAMMGRVAALDDQRNS